jgi:NADH dehydrogenase
MPGVFVSGAGGYVGRALLPAAAGRLQRIVALSRSPDRLPDELRALPNVTWVAGDLLEPESWATTLAGCSHVVHLAATTGKATPDVYRRTNVEGTRVLLERAKDAGVQGFLHVSTIATTFRDQRRYFYAHSKVAAEELVRQSGLPHAIVRPTIVLGRDSPVLAGLVKLATAPIVPVFGKGDVRVQPVAVEDLSACLLELLAGERFGGEEIDIGGPDVVSIEELLLRIAGRLREGRVRTLHLPLGFVRSCLALVEPLLLPLLPLTCGQLATFANDGVAAHSDFIAARSTPMRGLDDVLGGALVSE